MAVIKLTTEGKVVTRDGKPSCTCCGGCSCAEGMPDTYEVAYTEFLPPEIVTRESSCVWVGEWNQTPYGMQPMELRCEEGQWFLRLYYSGGAGYSDIPKIDPRTASPVGSYDTGATVSNAL